MSDNLDLSVSITTEEPEVAANLDELRFLVFQGKKGDTGDSAYEEAVKLGFDGTEAEWLASLKGEKGDTGFSPEITSSAIPGGHRIDITNELGPDSFYVMDGEDGADGVSPTVQTEAITGGHRVTITDKAHPHGQSFDVMDGEDGEDGVSPTVAFEPITVDGRTGNKMTVTDAAHPQGQSINVLNGKDSEGAVLYNTTQSLTGSEKATARGNIDAIGQIEYEAIQADIRSVQADVSNKADAADLPTKVSELENDANYATKAEVDQKLVGAMSFKGTKATVSELPATGNTKGDVWHINADGSERAWNGSTWEELGTAVDLSGKQDTISDLATIRSNAAAGAAKISCTEEAVAGYGFTKNAGTYVKPSGGIPASDLASDVQEALDKGKSLRLLYDGGFAPSDPDLMLMGNVANAETGNAIATALYYGRIGSAVLVDVTDSNTEVVYDLFAVDYDAQTHVSTVVFARTEADCIRTATLSGSTKTAPVFGTIPLAGGSAENAVLYTAQTLTPAQQAQARGNLGAGTYSKPNGGIPASDLASGVIPTVPQMATQADMSDWTSGKTVDASVLASGFSAAMDALGAKADAYKLNALATFTDGGDAVVPLFTNQLPISTDTDGTIYNNGTGWINGYRIDSSGELVAFATAGSTGFIPIANAQNAVLRFSGMRLIADPSATSTGSAIWYYDSTYTKIGGAQTKNLVIAETDSDGYASEIDLSQQTVSGRIPSADTAYIRVCSYGMNADSIITINEEIAYDEYAEITSASLKSSVIVPQLAPLDARITALEEDEGGGTIDSTDPLVKYAKQIDNGLTVGYEPTLTNRPTANLVAKKYLNFLHISDTHGSVNAENAVKILNKLKADGRCSFLIHTGDFHSSTFADAASWNTFAGYIAQATAPVLLVSGNHDVGNNSQSTTDGTTATDAQLYARCFEPYISGWGLTSHPTGKCYWYKDFADEGVRLIGLHDFESDYATDSNGQLLYKRGYAAYHQAQIDWLVQALLSCPAGYGVIIAKHNPMNKRGTLDNPFNGEFLQGQNTAQSYVSKDMIAEIVQAFMDGTTINKSFAQTGNVTDTLTVNQDFSGKNSGAHFVCYLDGHTHADGVNFLADFPKQLELNVGCDNYHYQHYSDTYNQQNTLHQDLLNYVSVDVNRGFVYIQRIGNDYTAQADRRDFTAIDYKNPPTAADDPSEAIEALDSRIAVFEDYPLVKEYTAQSVQTGIFTLTFDRPLKALRVLIEGVANSDVSAKQTVTLQIGTGSTSFYSASKILYGQIVSNTVFTAFIDVRLDKAMKKWISDGAIGTVNATNGFLNARQLNVINAAVDEGRTNIFNLRIRNDSDQTNGVSVTTGTNIKVYGLEA